MATATVVRRSGPRMHSQVIVALGTNCVPRNDAFAAACEASARNCERLETVCGPHVIVRKLAGNPPEPTLNAPPGNHCRRSKCARSCSI